MFWASRCTPIRQVGQIFRASGFVCGFVCGLVCGLVCDSGRGFRRNTANRPGLRGKRVENRLPGRGWLLTYTGMKRIALCLSLIAPGLALPVPLAAHPHIFVDTTLRLSTDAQGRATGIEVTWVYDDFFSLLIFEDMALDADGDAQLTEAELKELWGFDMIEWPPGFEGDLYVHDANGIKIELGFPVVTSIDVIDGRIVASHRRDIPPTPADGLRIRQYDPTFYVAYEVTGGLAVTPPCKAAITKPDLDQAAEEKLAELARIPEDRFEVMEVGHLYADRILVTCAPSP